MLVESVKDYAIFLLDPDGRVQSWNEGARRIKGYSADEIIGEHFSKFYLPEDVAAGECRRQLEIALREGRLESFGWRLRKDGSPFWASVVLTCLHDDDGGHLGFAKVTRDLTDQSFRIFVEATNAVVWTADRNGRANVDSPSWRAFTGQTKEEWLGLRGWEPVHPDDRQGTAAQWARAKAERTTFEAEFRLRRQDGAYVWMAARALPLLNPDGSLREWFGVTFDISARKAAEARAVEALDRERSARLRAEQAEARWTTTLRSIGDGVIATDVGGRVTFMNPVAETLTGERSADSLGKPLATVFPIVNEQTRRPVRNPVERVLEEGVVVGLANHTVLVRSDGAEIAIADSAAPIRDGEGRLFGVVLVFRDASEESREAARREFLAQAGEALTMSIHYADTLTTIVNLAIPRLADCSMVHTLDVDDSRPKLLAISHVDSARLAAYQELERGYPLEATQDRAVLRVIQTGRAELHSHISTEILDNAALDPEQRRLVGDLEMNSLMIVPLRGRERVFGAMTFVYAQSDRHYGEDDLAFAEQLAGRAALVIERRKLEDERAVLLERERQARDLADMANRAKDEFLATASHELRNPLQAILGWSTVLMRKELPADVHRALAIIDRNARAQARMIEDVLDISRVISGKLRLELVPIALAQTVADAVDSLRPDAEAKSVELLVRVDPGLDVLADPVRLRQIVCNLISNAVKFSPKGGTVSIDAGRGPAGVVITVRDMGEGIDPGLLSAIFEPFRQADASTTRRHGGLGLGLAVVRQLVHAHGGTVHAYSEGKGRGATFTVQLPERRPAPTPRPERPRSAPELRAVRILVVDDQPDALDLVSFLLTSAGAQVQTARSAHEALEKLVDFRPAVMVSDIGMPEVDGYALLRRVRLLEAARGGQTPALALTAYAGGDDAERCHAAGFQMHLAKPVDPEQLVVAVAKLAGIAVGAVSA
jgi:PAS domain S-box-containing protein